MIKLFDNYAVDADKYCYIAGLVAERVTKTKKGETVKKECMYDTTFHPTLVAAVRACVERAKRKEVYSYNQTLEDAVRRQNSLEQKFEELLKNIAELTAGSRKR